MGNSKKNNAAVERERLHKSDQTPNPLLEDEDDMVYELTDEDINTETASIEQIKQLQHTQKSIRLQLDDAFLDIDKLTRQFKKERQTRRASLTSYIALMIAGIALIMAVGSVYFLSDSQENVDNLVRSVDTLKKHNHTQQDDLSLQVENPLDQQNAQTSTDTSVADDIASKKNTPEDPLTFTGSGIPAPKEADIVPPVDTNASDAKKETENLTSTDSEASSVTENTSADTATNTSDDKKEVTVDPLKPSETEPSSSTTDNSAQTTTPADNTSTDGKKELATDELSSTNTDAVPVLDTTTPATDVSTTNDSDVKTEATIDPLKALESTSSTLSTNLLPAASSSTDTSTDKKETIEKTPSVPSTETPALSDNPSLSDTLLKQKTAASNALDANKAIETNATNPADVNTSDSKKEAEKDTTKANESSSEKPASLSDTLLKEETAVTPETTTPETTEKSPEAATPETTEKSPEALKSDDKAATSETATAAMVAAETATTEDSIKKNSDAVKNDDKTATSETVTTETPEKPPEVEKKEDKKDNTSATLKHGWVVILGSYKNSSRANRNNTAYNEVGFTTSIAKIRSGGRSWHQISTNAFKTKREARQYLRTIKRKVKIESSMIIRR